MLKKKIRVNQYGENTDMNTSNVRPFSPRITRAEVMKKASEDAGQAARERSGKSDK